MVQPATPAAPTVSVGLFGASNEVVLVDWTDPRPTPGADPNDPCEIEGYDV